MKKIVILMFSLFIALTSFSQQIKLEQKVSRKESRQQLTYDKDDYRKQVSRKKDFTLTVSSTRNMEIMAIIFVLANGEISCDYAEGQISPKQNFVYTTSASAESEKINISFKKYGWGDDIKRKYGDDKVELVAFVYDKSTGKFIGSKNTSSFFANRIQSGLKDEIAELVKSKVTPKS